MKTAEEFLFGGESGASSFASIVKEAAQAHDVPESYLSGIIRVESRGNPKAVNRESGAAGLMGFMPETAREYGIDPHDPQQSIFAGAKKLRGLLNRYEGDSKLALMAYYAGEGNVDAWLKGEPSGVGPRSLSYPGKVMGYASGKESRRAALSNGKAVAGVESSVNRDAPNALAFLTAPEPEQSSFFSTSSAFAAEPPLQDAPSATDFLMGTTDQPSGKAGGAGRPQSAEEFLTAPEPEGGGVLSDLGTGARRAAGIVLGTLNSPHAFVMGGARARNKDPEAFEKLPWWEKNMVSLGSAFESAYESIAVPGKWGSDVNEASRFYTGKTIEENLPEKLKPYSLSIEFLASIITDPAIAAGEASRIITSLGNKKLYGELAKSIPELLSKTQAPPPAEVILKDLEKISGLEAKERAEVQGQLLNLLRNREDYARRVTEWGEAELAKVEMKESLENAPKMLPPGQGFELRGAPEEVMSRYSPELAEQVNQAARPALPAGQGFELVDRAPEVVRREHGAYPRGESYVAGVEQDVPVMVKRGEELQEAVNLNADTRSMLAEARAQLNAADGPSLKHVEGEGYSRLKSGNPDWFQGAGYTRQQALQTIDSALSGELLTEKQTGFVRGVLDAKEIEWMREGHRPAWSMTQGEYVDDAFSKFEQGLQRGMTPQQARDTFVAPVERNAHLAQVERALSQGKAVPDEVLRDYPDLAAKYRPDSLSQIFSKADPKYMKASGGFIAGVGEDEEGNVTFDSGKALGGLLLAGGIKSLTGKGRQKFLNTLSKNPAWSKVHGMIGQERKPFSLAGVWTKFNTTILDRFYPLKDVSPETYEEARKFAGYKDVAKQKFDDLAAALAPVRKSEALFTDYVTAHRAMDRADRGLKNPNGVTLSDARQAIREIETHYAQAGKDPKELKTALKAFQTWTHDEILKPALDNGIISKRSYDAIVAKNRWYAAFEVIENLPQDLGKLPALPSKEFFSVANQGVIKKMRGTEKLIRNPIESTIRKFVDAQATFARNRVASTFIGDPAVKGLLQPVADSPKELAIMQARGLNPVLEGAWDKRAFDTVNRFKDGRVERFIAPVELAESMKQLSPKQAPRVVQALNNVFRQSATTLYLPFTISNAMRDALMAFSTSKTYTPKDIFGRYQLDWVKGLIQGVKQELGGGSATVRDYLESGGGFGYVGELRNTDLARSQLFEKTAAQQAWAVVKSPITLIEKVSAAVELAPRLAVYERALTRGMTPAQAAMAARESTIDFSKGGSLTKVANQFVPFLNARVQGRLKTVEALKDDPKNTLAKIFTAAVLPGMAAYAYNRVNHSDLYDDIPEHIRQNYYTLITGTTQDEKGRTVPRYLVISKGDVGQIAFNPIEYVFDQVWEKDRISARKFLVNYLADLSPVDFAREGELSLSKAAGSLLPPIVKGAAEDWANLNLYTGKEIVPYYQGKSKPAELQYKENTPATYKWLGKELGVSPLRLRNFASNLLAGYGREGLAPSAMARGLTGRLVKTQGGEKEDRAWTVIKDIENGYTYTRAFAQEMAKQGDRSGALDLMRKWNSGLSTRISELQKYGVKDRGGLRRDYSFTPEKMINVVAQRKDGRTPLEKKLSVK